MDALVSSFGNTSLGGGVMKLEGTLNVYISEVSSLSRLWIQNESESDRIDSITNQLEEFHSKQGNGFSLKSSEVKVGMKVAAFTMHQWNRAEVISNVKEESQSVRLFFLDYGTTGYLNLKFCRRLMEQFSNISRKTIRGALYGIKPPLNARLWDFSPTMDFINAIKNKVHKIRIMKYHSDDDFYEFLLYDTDGSLFNQKFINIGIAEPVIDGDQPPMCLSYPSFNMLEKLDIYPTFGERSWVFDKFGIDLNIFEETFIPPDTTKFTFGNELAKIFNDPNYSKYKDIFMKLFKD